MLLLLSARNFIKSNEQDSAKKKVLNIPSQQELWQLTYEPDLTAHLLGLYTQVLVAVVSERSCGKLLHTWRSQCPWIRDRPAAIQGQAHQQWWQQLGESIFNKWTCYCTAATAAREEWECVRGTALKTPRSVKTELEELLQAPEQRFLCSP